MITRNALRDKKSLSAMPKSLPNFTPDTTLRSGIIEKKKE